MRIGHGLSVLPEHRCSQIRAPIRRCAEVDEHRDTGGPVMQRRAVQANT